MMKSICFVTDAFISDTKATITGPMVQTYLLGKELLRRGWAVHFISYNKENKFICEEFEGITIHWLAYRSLFVLFDFQKIQRLLKSINPEYCYQRGRDPLTGFTAHYCVHHSKSLIWASAGESGVLKNKYKSGLAIKKKSFLKKCLLWPLAWIQDHITEYGIRKAKYVIVQTSYQKEILKQQFNRNGIVIKSGHPRPDPVNRNLPWKILWIGSIKPVKQPELFIELAELCCDLNCEFIMAGQIIDAEYGKNILNIINTMPNLRYAGVIPFQDSQRFISQSHILVNTTRKDYEGLPNAFVQAWLAGTITVSLESDPDGVIEKHELGIRAGNVEKMSEFIRQLTQDPSIWNGLSKHAEDFAKDNYSIESITDQLEKLIENG
jgi:glycosyltransferase involved in cell wall biosynthesis